MNKLKFLRWLFSACMHTKSFASFVWSNTRGSGTCSAKHTRHPHVGHQHVRQVKEMDQEEKSFTLNGHFLDSFLGQWRKKKIFSPSFLFFIFKCVVSIALSSHLFVEDITCTFILQPRIPGTSSALLLIFFSRDSLLDAWSIWKMKIFTDFLKTSQKLNQNVSMFR